MRIPPTTVGGGMGWQCATAGGRSRGSIDGRKVWVPPHSAHRRRLSEYALPCDVHTARPWKAAQLPCQAGNCLLGSGFLRLDAGRGRQGAGLRADAISGPTHRRGWHERQVLRLPSSDV